MHGRFRYIHPQGIDHFCSLKTNRWLLDSLLGHLKKKFFCLNFRPVVGFPVKQPITSAESPVFTITKANTKSKYGKNRQKGYDGDDVDADMMKMLLIMLMRMLMMMMLMMMLMMMSRKNVSSLISGTQTS